MELASSAMATFPPDRRSPMMPEPTTAINKNAVTTNSAQNGASERSSLLSDPVHFFLHAQAVQTGYGQAQQQADPAIQRDEHIAKCPFDLLG